MTVSFPFTMDQPGRFTGPLPASSGAVIIGGGVLGVTAALFLNRAGVPVTLLEKGRIAGEQSSRNWGWVRQLGRDLAELPIMIEARRHWLDLAGQCESDIGLRETGVSYLARQDSELAEFADFQAQMRDHDVACDLLDPDQVAAHIPGMARRFRGGILAPTDLRAEPWLAVPALARLAASEGVTIRDGTAARALDLQGGRVSGVITEAGPIACDRVLVAAGAWSSLFLRNHGVTIPQLSVRATVAATAPLAEVHAGAATDEHIAFRRRADGGFTLAAGGRHQLLVGPDAFRHAPRYLRALARAPLGTGYRPAAPQGFPDGWTTPRRFGPGDVTPFERMRILNPAPEPAALRAMQAGMAGLFPELAEVPLQKSWAGMIDAMPDFVPIADAVAALPGLFLATGMSGHGFGIGPGFGRIMADLMQGNAPGHDMARFRLSRFSDGSALRLGPAI